MSSHASWTNRLVGPSPIASPSALQTQSDGDRIWRRLDQMRSVLPTVRQIAGIIAGPQLLGRNGNQAA
jgi:hypothetical protein